MSEGNKALVARFYEAWNSQDLTIFDEIIADDYVDHDERRPAVGERGPEGMKRAATQTLEAFPDTCFDIEHQLEDGDFVVTRWRATGTQTGPLWQGHDPTSRRTSVMGITISRVTGGRIAEDWTCWDEQGMLTQLGLSAPVAG